MRREIKEWNKNKTEKNSLRIFLSAINLEEPNFANTPLTSILVMTNWNSYDR